MPSSRSFWLLLLISSSCLTQAQNLTYRYRVDKMAIYKGDSMLSPYEFTELGFFNEGKTWAAKGELYGFVDSTGKTLIPFIYHDVRSFKDNRCFVSPDSGYHFQLIDENGTALTQVEFTEVGDFKNRFVAVRGDSNWGLLNTNGNLTLDTIYDHPPIVVDSNFIIVYRNGKCGVINSRREILHPFRYDFLSVNGEAYLKENRILINRR